MTQTEHHLPRGLAPKVPDPGDAPADRTPPAAQGHVARILDTSPFPILLVCLVGIVLLSAFAPSLVVGDTWLTLVAGREVNDHGLPSTEHLTILGEGRTWTDQQWLAQVVFYAAHALAGMRAVILLGIAFVLLALGLATATARTSGASSRSTFVIGVLAILAGPWGWTLRAQTTALPLFAGTLWLLVDASRRGVRRRTLLVLPLLVLWANLHGSVVLGAILAMLLGAVELVRARRLASIPLALIVLSPIAVLASPYGTKLVAYYDLMLVDAPFAEILREWQWSSPSATTALFWLLALVAAGLLALRRCRSRLTVYELAVFAVTFVGAVQAVRGVIWFAFVAAAILPVALDGVLTKADVEAPKVNRVISVAALAGLAVALVAFLARPATWFVSEWPEAQVEAVSEATRDPSVKLWATDGTADWLLWRVPDLRGRIAYDIRFELYDEAALDRIVDYGTRTGDWQRALDGYRVVVVDDRAHLEALAAEPGARVTYRDEEIAIVERR
ncbi:MAG: hypothetical protein M5U27_00105 [Gaiella sp.]|nr:hypothetical protein [Gaiella sp.]